MNDDDSDDGDLVKEKEKYKDIKQQEKEKYHVMSGDCKVCGMWQIKLANGAAPDTWLNTLRFVFQLKLDYTDIF